ncbi:MAG: hypothetical protein ABI697_00470 [Devosia sp.]
MASAHPAAIDPRAALYDALLRRNRIVGALRLAVPLLGVLVFIVLAAQIYVASLARQYGVSNIRIDRGSVVVATPRYSATAADGTHYDISATEARAPIEAAGAITMSAAELEVASPGKPVLHVTAAQVDTDAAKGTYHIPGLAQLRGSDGLTGTLGDLAGDVHAGKATSGPVDIVFGDGSRLVARSGRFDATARTLNLEHVTMTLPRLPEALP